MPQVKEHPNEELRKFLDEMKDFLKGEPDMRLPLKGKFPFFSGYCDSVVQAVDIHLDKKTGELILVGMERYQESTVRSDERDTDGPGIRGDYAQRQYVGVSQGLRRVSTYISRPFEEVFNDMNYSARMGLKINGRPCANGSVLIGRSRKAVLDNYVSKTVFELRELMRRENDRQSALRLDEVLEGRPAPKILSLDAAALLEREIEKNGKKHTVFLVRTTGGMELNLFNLPLDRIREFSREALRPARDLFRSAEKEFLSTVSLETSHGGRSMSVSAEEQRAAEAKGLADLYTKGEYPIRVLHGVAKSGSRNFSDVFDTRRHAVTDIDRMVKEYNKGGRRAFGFGERPLQVSL